MTVERWVALGIALAGPLLMGLLFGWMPRATRRDFLFGVFTGPERAWGPEAMSLRRGWTRAIAALSGAGSILGSAAVLLARSPGIAWGGAIGGILLVLLGTQATYLRNYLRARTLGIAAPPVAAAPLGPRRLTDFVPLPIVLLPLLTPAAGLAYTIFRWPDIPDRVATHFGFSGAPDAWSAKSAVSVFMLPGMALFMSAALVLLNFGIAAAKQSLRVPGIEASAQRTTRFRRDLCRWFAGLALLLSVMLGWMSILQVRVWTGEAPGLGQGWIVFMVIMELYALGGVAWLLVSRGQGGDRLPGDTAAEGMTTDGLAANEKWTLGVFYVNREDPSWFVEHRFGLGYTLNFGNPLAVAVFVIFLGLLLGGAALAVFGM